mmetsp:Transcript_91480/g.238390  ORF Transcript_91480/g.238390 Transcript_91480/m.238390 type:complete len:276 (-) Transcript_91480:50-877(-)
MWAASASSMARYLDRAVTVRSAVNAQDTLSSSLQPSTPVHSAAWTASHPGTPPTTLSVAYWGRPSPLQERIAATPAMWASTHLRRSSGGEAAEAASCSMGSCRCPRARATSVPHSSSRTATHSTQQAASRGLPRASPAPSCSCSSRQGPSSCCWTAARQAWTRPRRPLASSATAPRSEARTAVLSPAGTWAQLFRVSCRMMVSAICLRGTLAAAAGLPAEAPAAAKAATRPANPGVSCPAASASSPPRRVPPSGEQRAPRSCASSGSAAGSMATT